MKRTRQRFLWSVAVLLALQGALALAITLPVLLDAGLEATHVLLEVCRHPFRAHYLSPAALVALLLTSLTVAGVIQFGGACVTTIRRTRLVTAPLLASAYPTPPPRVLALADRYGLAGSVDVVETARLLAFCHGLRRPRICVSTGLCALLDDAELGSVLLHEEAHRRRREPVRLTLFAGLAHVLRFWPAVGPLVAEACLEMEVAADAEAVQRSGSVQALARALLKVLRHPAPSLGGPGQLLSVAPFSPIAARIECLTRATAQPYPPLSWRYFGSLAVALVVPVTGLFVLASTTDLHSALHPCGLL